MDSHNATTNATRRLWLWPIANLVGLPVGGGIAHLAVGGVDAPLAALLAGLIAGLIIGAAQWFVLRRLVSWLWVPATCAGMASGLVAGSAVVGYGISRVDLAFMGVMTGLALGVLQALVLGRSDLRRIGALLWAIAIPPSWALGWFVSSYVIARNIDDRFPVFGASGAAVFGLLTWLLLMILVRRSSAARATAPSAAHVQ